MALAAHCDVAFQVKKGSWEGQSWDSPFRFPSLLLPLEASLAGYVRSWAHRGVAYHGDSGDLDCDNLLLHVWRNRPLGGPAPTDVLKKSIVDGRCPSLVAPPPGHLSPGELVLVKYNVVERLWHANVTGGSWVILSPQADLYIEDFGATSGDIPWTPTLSWLTRCINSEIFGCRGHTKVDHGGDSQAEVERAGLGWAAGGLGGVVQDGGPVAAGGHRERPAMVWLVLHMVQTILQRVSARADRTMDFNDWRRRAPDHQECHHADVGPWRIGDRASPSLAGCVQASAHRRAGATSSMFRTLPRQSC